MTPEDLLRFIAWLETQRVILCETYRGDDYYLAEGECATQYDPIETATATDLVARFLATPK